MSDRTDNLIEAIVVAREAGFSRNACVALVADCYAAPWSGPERKVRVHGFAPHYVTARARSDAAAMVRS
jgi:hypothetical protein